MGRVVRAASRPMAFQEGVDKKEYTDECEHTEGYVRKVRFVGCTCGRHGTHDIQMRLFIRRDKQRWDIQAVD